MRCDLRRGYAGGRSPGAESRKRKPWKPDNGERRHLQLDRFYLELQAQAYNIVDGGYLTMRYKRFALVGLLVAAMLLVGTVAPAVRAQQTTWTIGVVHNNAAHP